LLFLSENSEIELADKFCELELWLSKVFEFMIKTPPIANCDTCVVEGVVEGRVEGVVEGRVEGVVEGRVEGRVEGVVDGAVDGKLPRRSENMELILLRLPIKPIEFNPGNEDGINEVGNEGSKDGIDETGDAESKDVIDGIGNEIGNEMGNEMGDGVTAVLFSAVPMTISRIWVSVRL